MEIEEGKHDVNIYDWKKIYHLICDLSERIKYGHYRPSSDMPFKWHFTGGLMMARGYMLTGIFHLNCCFINIPGDGESLTGE